MKILKAVYTVHLFLFGNSYIKTLFPTHFPYITALLFLEVGEREDNRTIKYQIYPDYNWEEESYKPIPGCYNQQKRLEHQQI